MLARVLAFKNTGVTIRFTFRVDSTDLAELAYSESATAESLMFYELASVTAGSAHTFTLRYRRDGGSGSSVIYYGRIHIFDLGRV
jgi:hypothetical protein